MSGLPAEFCAAAKNVTVLPTSKETLGAGLRLTTAGTWFLVTCVGFPLLQDARKRHAARPDKRVVRDLADANLPMHAFRRNWRINVFRKTLSVEAEFFFGNRPA